MFRQEGLTVFLIVVFWVGNVWFTFGLIVWGAVVVLALVHSEVVSILLNFHHCTCSIALLQRNIGRSCIKVFYNLHIFLYVWQSVSTQSLGAADMHMAGRRHNSRYHLLQPWFVVFCLSVISPLFL